MQLSTYQLTPNFMVVFMQVRDFETATVTLLNHIGAGQSPWPEGAVHMLEHLLVAQTGQSNSEGFTDRERMWIQFWCLRDEWKTIPKILQSLLGSDFLTLEKIEHEKKTISAEIRYRNWEKGRAFHYEWNKAVWSDPAMRRTRIGVESVVNNLSLEQLRQVHQGFCQQSHTLFIVGNFEAVQNQVVAAIKKALPQMAYAPVKIPVVPLVEPPVVPKSENLEVGYGWVIDMQHLKTIRQKFLFELTQILLIRGRDSFVLKVLGKQLGAIYSPENLSKLFTNECVIGVKFQIQAKIWEKARSLLEVGKKEFFSQQISRASLDELKLRWIKRALLSVESTTLFPYWVGDHEWAMDVNSEVRLRDFWQAELDQISSSDLEKYLKTVITDQSQRIVVV